MRAALTGCRLLVAEDQELNQQVLREILEQVRAIVTVVDDGRQAVTAATTAAPPFDAVLMDLQMPVLDGYGATLIIREQISAHRLPIIAMTAHAMKEERDHCLAGGMNDHLAKPVNPDRLYACLIRLVRSGCSEMPLMFGEPNPESEKGATLILPQRLAQVRPGVTILLVDRDPAIITRLNEMLPEHHTCLAATDGATAMKLALSTQPDLILLNGAMDGYELCRALSGNQATAEIPLILLLSGDDSQEIVTGFSAGAVDYIANPLDVIVVNARVNIQLQLVAARSELARLKAEISEAAKPPLTPTLSH